MLGTRSRLRWIVVAPRAAPGTSLICGCSWRVPFCSEPIVTGLRTGRARAFGSLLVQRDRRDAPGGRKKIFLSRDIDDATRAAARRWNPVGSWSRRSQIFFPGVA